MQEKVFAYLKKWNMIAQGESVLVGFSGGADSTALLLLLREYTARQGGSVLAVHVHHGIRGEKADRDQDFCEAFCRERGIPYRCIRKDVPGLAKSEGIGIEEAGRNVRREAFEALLQKGEASRIALAHHQNDQAETMLFRLMRGSGLKGLKGMEPVRGRYIRPLLCVTRQEIKEWLKDRDIAWVEDETNQDPSYTRNQIRHQILSPMERIRPGSIRHLAAAAQQLKEADDFLEQETIAAWNRCAHQTKNRIDLSVAELSTLHPAVAKRVLLRGMEHLRGSAKDLQMVHAEAVLALKDGARGSRISLPGHLEAVLEYESLSLQRSAEKRTAIDEIALDGEMGQLRFGGYAFSYEILPFSGNEKIPANRYTKYLDCDKIRQEAVFRSRRPGDFLAVDAGAHKKLKDYFIDEKVPRKQRDDLPLLADGSHILWVVGMRISEEYKVTEQTKRVLKIHCLQIPE